METTGNDGEFDDVGAVFQHIPPVESYQTIYRQVLAAYGYRCALTGQQFEILRSGLHPDLQVVAIRPREQGGPLHVSNFLCLDSAAERAFRLGHVIIANDYAIIADRRVLVAALADRIAPDARLHLPADPLYHPDPAHFAFHRNNVLRA